MGGTGLATTTVGIVTGAGSGMGRACATQLSETVDVLLLVDRNEGSVADTASHLSDRGPRAAIEALAVDVTDVTALEKLASKVAESGTLRSVAHAAGISPTMADWRTIFSVDLVGSALLTEKLWPLAVTGTSIVCFASMAPLLGVSDADPTIDAALDDPLHLDLLDRLHDAVGPAIEDSGMAYMWAKRGVHRLVQREAVRFGQKGARICSVSPGIIDTPMGQQESAARSTNEILVSLTPLGRQGRAEEVAAVTAFLLSDQASFVNGIDVLVDGGVVAAVRNSSLTELGS
jgi:NAD(P)-dependent dehydrogenase (short-subunit alcohol dehydrogenase family)